MCFGNLGKIKAPIITKTKRHTKIQEYLAPGRRRGVEEEEKEWLLPSSKSVWWPFSKLR
jgi:predicted RNA binding protein with dsRBD fold (UPF0201 family)